MHPLQRQLNLDHYHFKSVLNCLQSEICCYESGSTRRPELRIILDALDYIQVYPEVWHHPVEDLIFARLISKGVAEANLIGKVMEEHKIIEQHTQRLVALFEAVAKGCIVPADELVECAHHYIILQGSHLEREDELIYPLMEKYLAEQDWQDIETQHRQVLDPMFNLPQKQVYESLCQYVLQSEREAQSLSVH